MDDKKKTNIKDDTLFLDQYDDQYKEIKECMDIIDSSDSETTDLAYFRVLNSNNAYPQKSNDIKGRLK